MIIDARYVRTPTHRRQCELCRLPIEGAAIRLYGMADPTDPVQTVWRHPDCCKDVPGIQDALERTRRIREQRTKRKGNHGRAG